MTIPEIRVLPDLSGIAHAAADLIVQAAASAITEHGEFSIALSGGTTPKALYELLSGSHYRSQIDWAKVLIFFGDERCVPPNHPESNFRMADQTLLSQVPIPGDNIYRMLGELDPKTAADDYEAALKERFNDRGMDMVLLGMGDDGHTLSLFPGTAAASETSRWVVANYAEHSTTGKSWRITLTAPFVNRSRRVMVLVTGTGKAKVLSEVLEGPPDPGRLPIQLINPQQGTLIWLMDTGAAGMNAESD